MRCARFLVVAAMVEIVVFAVRFVFAAAVFATAIFIAAVFVFLVVGIIVVLVVLIVFHTILLFL